MNDKNLNTIEQVREFLVGSEATEFKGTTIEEKYAWIEEVLVRFRYIKLNKAEKGVIRKYIEKFSGYSPITSSQADTGIHSKRTMKEGTVQKVSFSQALY
ncbi:hypothetical protein ACFLTQ_02925 [Chloroflexota bacterium]